MSTYFCDGTLSSGTVKLISYEFLTGREIYAGLDAKELLHRVFSVFGHVKIIITIREQRAMIESVYRHYVGSGGALHVRELLFKRSSPGVDGFGSRCLLAKFRYDNIIRHCGELFGEDRVKVFPHELIKSDPKSFVEAFASFLSVDVPSSFSDRSNPVNQSVSYTGIALMRWINQVVGTPLSDSPFLRLVPAMWTRFVFRLFLPVDRLVLRRWGSRKRFVDKRMKWFLRVVARRLLVLLFNPSPPSVQSDQVRGHNEQSTLVNLIRYLDWPDIDEVYEEDRGNRKRERIADRLADVYADSNARTAAMTGLPLRELGYSVSQIGEGDTVVAERIV